MTSCTGCANSYSRTALGFVPIDENGNPTTAFFTWPAVHAVVYDDPFYVETRVFFSFQNPPYGQKKQMYGESSATLHMDDIIDETTKQDFLDAGALVIVQPGGEDDNDTGVPGACKPNPTQPPPQGEDPCVEDKPCTGSVKYRFEIVSYFAGDNPGSFGKAYYSLKCGDDEGEVGTGTPGSPTDPGDSDALPADPGGNPTPQPAVNHPEDPNNPGTPDLTKVAIEVSLPGCGCERIVAVEIKDGNGKRIRLKGDDGKQYQLMVAVKATCTKCDEAPPPPATGLCCYETDNDDLCCAEDVTKEECEQLAGSGAYWGWDAGGGSCLDCPVDPDPSSAVEEAPAGEFNECDPEN